MATFNTLKASIALKKVKTFTEKPELHLAKTFLESGEFVWNAGIFVWRVKAILAAFQKHLPEMAEVFEEASSRFGTPEEKKRCRLLTCKQKVFRSIMALWKSR
jgi:mannose-1-phosphate guanylyltransferase